MPGISNLVAGRFALEREIGSGYIGSVHLARDLQNDAPVALKLLSDLCGHADQQRFLRESALIAEMAHPHLVRYVAFGEDGLSTPYLAMEWLDAKRLDQRLARAELTLREAVDLARRVAEALAALHARGIVHRGLKPQNLFLPGGDPAGVKLSDPTPVQTQRPPVKAVPRALLDAAAGYMSPEQTRTDQADARSDVFSLGALLFHCIAGRAPFEGGDTGAVMARVVSKEAAPPLSTLRPDAPRALCELVAAMLSKSSAERPADGSEMARALLGVGYLGGAAPRR